MTLLESEAKNNPTNYRDAEHVYSQSLDSRFVIALVITHVCSKTFISFHGPIIWGNIISDYNNLYSQRKL